MTPIEIIFAGILSVTGIGLTAVVGWFVWQNKKTITTVEQHSVDITRIQDNMVTEGQVRSIFHQSNSSIIEKMDFMQSQLTNLTSIITARELKDAEREGYEAGYEKAMKEAKENGANK